MRASFSHGNMLAEQITEIEGECTSRELKMAASLELVRSQLLAATTDLTASRAENAELVSSLPPPSVRVPPPRAQASGRTVLSKAQSIENPSLFVLPAKQLLALATSRKHACSWCTDGGKLRSALSWAPTHFTSECTITIVGNVAFPFTGHTA
jgi:hypothetical protein